jgi:hypothetical protein
MKEYWGSGSIAPHILHLGIRWRFVVSFTPLPLYPQGKRPWYTLDRRLHGTKSRSGRGCEQKNYQPLPEIEPRSLSPQPIPIPGSCSQTKRLRYYVNPRDNKQQTEGQNCTTRSFIICTFHQILLTSSNQGDGTGEECVQMFCR